MIVDYAFRTFPTGMSTRPWWLLTGVKSNRNRHPPLTQHTRIRSRRGHFRQPLGLGHGPFRLLVAVRARNGMRSAKVTIPIR